MAADMVADEMRGYAPPMVDDRWAVQVSALGAEVWWGSDAEFLSARTGDPLRVAIELLHLMRDVHVLERLCALPGAARAGAWAAGSGAEAGTLGKIRALLAKAESTEFPEEAEALSARAQELMAKHSIDHALLAAQSGSKDRPAARRLPVDNPYESPKATLLHAVAQANRCRSVWQKAIGMSTVVGFPSDLDAVELLFTSLLVQANTAMLREGAKKDAYGRSRTRAFRQSFLVAYAYRIGVRLSEATVGADSRRWLPHPARIWCLCSESATRLSITPSARCSVRVSSTTAGAGRATRKGGPPAWPPPTCRRCTTGRMAAPGHPSTTSLA